MVCSMCSIVPGHSTSRRGAWMTIICSAGMMRSRRIVIAWESLPPDELTAKRAPAERRRSKVRRCSGEAKRLSGGRGKGNECCIAGLQGRVWAGGGQAWTGVRADVGRTPIARECPRARCVRPGRHCVAGDASGALDDAVRDGSAPGGMLVGLILVGGEHVPPGRGVNGRIGGQARLLDAQRDEVGEGARVGGGGRGCGGEEAGCAAGMCVGVV